MEILMKILSFFQIDGIVEFIHSQYSCFLSTKFLCPSKLLIIVLILESCAYLTVKKVQFYVFSIFFLYTFFI